MEEEELILLNYKSPKGQLIKFLEQKIKKPEIDDSLGQVLDKFIELINEQSTLLDNGIFYMNFAEDALLLQICGQFYAKRVDKLWDELLQFHTRMVKYDESTAKKCTDGAKREARKIELAKLEERLNRGKRKKISLVEPEVECPENGCYLFDVDLVAQQELFDELNSDEGVEDEQELPFDHDFEIFDEWHEIQRMVELERKKQGSILVAQYNKQKYRLKLYQLPNGDDIVYDRNDPEEFNTREGRLISVHHIRHLFEYNDRCLLPDEDFTVAKLRFAYVLTKKWMIQNKVDPNAPYETYKEQYEKYQREYFENEKRKIQNMPQRNSDDLLKFFKALEKKEQQARELQEKLRKIGVEDLPQISFQSLILEPLEEGYDGFFDPYIPDDSGCIKDLSKEAEVCSTLDKPRSDSGYFDVDFEADNETECEENTETALPRTGTPDFNKDAVENIGKEAEDQITNTQESVDKSQPEVPVELEASERDLSTDINLTESMGTEVEQESHDSPMSIQNPQKCTDSLEVAETAQFLNINYLRNNPCLKGSYIKQTDNMIMIVFNKSKDDIKKRSLKQMLEKGNKQMEFKNMEGNKRKLNVTNNEEIQPKRRRLSKKQIKILRKSLIKPVKEIKWESFYSQNYQTESGEGEIIIVEYESEVEDEVDIQNNEDHNVSGYHSDHDGSHLSEHDYCLPESFPLSVMENPGVTDSSITDIANNEVAKENDCHKLNFNSIDFLTELSKNTAISCKDHGNEKETEETVQTPYEQEREKARKHVAEWKEYITPKLKNLNERDFDIHQYGSVIMNNMVENESKYFSQLVEGKSSAEVVRYFISTLQLANTMNVEICGAQQGQLSNDTFQVKLLSKERYHEHFDSYQAPSVEGLRAKLKKLKHIKLKKNIQVKKETSDQNRKQVNRKTSKKPLINTGVSRTAETVSTKRASIDSSILSPAKKIKILNHVIINSSNQLTPDFQEPSTSHHGLDFESEQSSTIERGDISEKEVEVNASMAGLGQTPSRISVDSGFIPSCDEDNFFEQFYNLQQNNNLKLQSTPIKPRKKRF